MQPDGFYLSRDYGRMALNKAFGLLCVAAIVFATMLEGTSRAQQEQDGNFVWRRIPNNIFSVGEKFFYDIKWQFVTAGNAVIEVKEITDINSRPSYKIATEARSTPFIDNFFKVRDINISYMDVESICSHMFESDINEGNFHKKEKIIFDHLKRTFTRLPDGKTGTTAPWVQDVLSSLYFTRFQNLDEGKDFSFSAHSGDRTYPLVVRILKKEKVKVPAGEFECYKLEPQLQGEGVFKAQGKLWVWLTADSRRMPVLMKSKVFIGSVDAVLTGYSPR